MANLPKEHETLYFDALCRTQKKETILSLIMATFYAKNRGLSVDETKEEIARRLQNAYGLYRDNIRGYDNGCGSYVGNLGQFESQYTIGHEMAIWKNSELDLTDLALEVAEYKITVVEYFDIIFLNYIQPIQNKSVHLLYSILNYMKENNLTIFEKNMTQVALGVISPEGAVNALFNMLGDTSYFTLKNNQLYLNENININQLISRCNIKYVGEDGLRLARIELSTSESYCNYISNRNLAVSELEDYSEQELGKILRQYYDNQDTEKVTGIHLFGIKYGPLIKIKDYNRRNIISESGINESYISELNKGICLSDYTAILENKQEYVIKEKFVDNGERIKGGFNMIYYGAPGTGKSHKITEFFEENRVEEAYIFRITFHPEYTYNDFIGQLLPTVVKSGEHKGDVTYDFQKGIFTSALKKAYENPSKAIYLVLEEMSRGNCAAIFGDIFQLLDRTKDGENEDWSKYFVNNEVIASEIKQINDDKIKIPSNLFIFGTVNTSDQNVFVMDTAFKRRFEWKYISTEPVLKDGQYLNNIDISLNDGTSEPVFTNWIELYSVLNKFISSTRWLALGEDKQIGQFFIEFDQNESDNKEKIKNKLLHYLWFDIQQVSYKTEVKLFNDTISNFTDLYNKFENNEKIFSDQFFECIKLWKRNEL